MRNPDKLIRDNHRLPEYSNYLISMLFGIHHKMFLLLMFWWYGLEKKFLLRISYQVCSKFFLKLRISYQVCSKFFLKLRISYQVCFKFFLKLRITANLLFYLSEKTKRVWSFKYNFQLIHYLLSLDSSCTGYQMNLPCIKHFKL